MNIQKSHKELEEENAILRAKLKACDANSAFNRYFENNKTIMLQIHPKTKMIVNANNAAIQFYGYSKEAFLKKGISALNTLPPKEIDELMQQAIRQKSDRYEFTHKLANGELKEVEICASPLNIDDHILMIITVYDISDRIKVKQQVQKQAKILDLIFTHSLDSIILLDKDFNFIKVSNTYAKACMLDISEFAGKNHFDLYPSSFETEANNARNGKYIYKRKARPFIFPDNPALGTTYWDLGLVPILDDAGEIQLFLFTLKDVTKEKKAEQERRLIEDALRKREQEVSESNRTKDKFFSIIAHDLKSPFTSMLGFSDMLLQNIDIYDKDKQQKFMNYIRDGLVDTLKLLENLLLWSRSQKGSIDYIPIKLELHYVVSETVVFFTNMTKNKNISISHQIEEQTCVLADENMLFTIMRNLVSNAIKFTHNGGSIHIESQSVTDKNGHNLTEITVSDTGVGISSNRLDELFSIIGNVSTNGTDLETGTGLGLVLCSEFIQKHNGTIRAESKVNQGSKFIFTIPEVLLSK